MRQTIQCFQEDIDCATQDYLGMTVAHYVSYSKLSSPKDMQLCLKDSVSPSTTRDTDGRTPLHLALGRENLDLIRYILNQSHEVSSLSDWSGQTLLHYATESPRTQAIDMVVALGFDTHATDLQGRTALYHAAEIGNLAAVKRLLDLGAMEDLERRDRRSRTPLQLAHEKGQERVVEYLRSVCDGPIAIELVLKKHEVRRVAKGSWAFLRYTPTRCICLLFGFLFLLIYLWRV